MDKQTKTYSLAYRFFHHLHTVNTHRWLVLKNCFACGLYYQGLTHDLSKYSPAEFFVSVKYYQGFQSPYMKEKSIKGYSFGWLHHKGRNKHHWEYWYDTINGIWGPQPMPYRYLLESICDRVAACHVYEKDAYTNASALNYFLTRHDGDHMHPKTAAEIEEMLRMIAEQGEAEAFAQFKKKWQSIKHTSMKDR